AFDAPAREECTAQRPRSNTPLAALVLLNDPTFVETARALGERILRDGGNSDNARLDFAFRRTTGRTPDDVERRILLGILAQNRRKSAADPGAAKALTHSGVAPAAADLDAVEWASWTIVARTLLNLSETNTRP